MKSIKTKGTLLFALVMLIFFIVLWGLSRGITREWARESIYKNFQQSASNIQRVTDEYLLQYISPLESLAKDSRIQSMDWDLQNEVLNQQATLEYLGVGVVDPDGIARYPDGMILDLSDRNYIQKGLDGEFNISGIIESRATGEMVQMIAYPIPQEEEIVGVMIARITPNFLIDLLGGETDELYSLYYVLDRDGYVMLHSEEDRVIEGRNAYDMGNGEDSEEMTEFLNASFENEKGFGSYQAGEDRLLIGYSRLQTLDWVLYIGKTENQIMAGLEGLNTLFLIAGVGILLTALLVYRFVFRGFVDPLVRMEKLFTQAAKGDLNVRSSHQSEDELGRVSMSFNKMMEQLKDLTYYDPVTMLPNQSVFQDHFQEKILKEKNEQRPMSILLLTIRNFSKVNERFGCKEGDRALRELSQRIRPVMTENSRLYRGKGDQFILFMEEKEKLEEGTLQILGRRILDRINAPLSIHKERVYLEGHIGIASYPMDGSSGEDLVKKAIFASNHEKKESVERVRIFDESLYEKDLEDDDLTKQIQEALADSQMTLHYQPIYHLESRRIEGFEALIRWNSPTLGYVAPDRFIPIAEKRGMIKEIDYWVIKKAINQLQRWKEEGMPLKMISVNLSSETFEDKGFENWLVKAMEGHGIENGLLQLELTERVVLKDVHSTIQKFNDLRNKGFRIAIDDFGVGYSSLSYLVKLPIDHLKIDRSFIQNIEEGTEAQIIASTLIKMGKELGIIVVAEGIETEEALNYLMMNGCQSGQGYYLDRPMDENKIHQLLQEGR